MTSSNDSRDLQRRELARDLFVAQLADRLVVLKLTPVFGAGASLVGTSLDGVSLTKEAHRVFEIRHSITEQRVTL
ncbi:MAG: hypothetical protein AAF517_06980 [Planctomycetota bacterium]